MQIRDFVVPLFLTAWVGTAFAVLGIPPHETLDANNARAIGRDLVSVTLPDGTTRAQHLTNNGGHGNQADIQAFINKGYLNCAVTGRATDGNDNIGCTGMDGEPLGGVQKL